MTARFLVAAAIATLALPISLASAASAQDNPPTGRLDVVVLDGGTGALTAFRARLTTEDGERVAAPQQATALMYGTQDRAEGYEVQPDGSFYVGGAFSQALPPGRYRLSITKGYEYVGQEHLLEVPAGGTLSRTIRLERWIDMPSRGWYSVDDHIHLRRSPRENPLILTWLAAEDIHVGALLQMGDIHATYYAQYAWGRDGVYQVEDRFLASGQEEPRTHEIGHTISLGADEFVRSTGQYYHFDTTFDRVHELGGLTGYAHQGVLFNGYRGLTLDVLRGKVDFMEVLQFCGDVQPLEVEHYYHFLDLGFRLTATAGSDFPWCGTDRGPQIGNARFYTYLEGPLEFDAWKDAVRAGHTFVSSGPVIELTVDGAIPGDELRVEPGSRVMVRARAYGHDQQVPLGELEVVAHGEVVGRSLPGEATGQDQAALLAARNNKEKVDMHDFELAKDKVMMGAERRSMIISEEEKRNTAFHEAGHALVAKLLPGADPIHKVTIIPRGMALGLTQQLPIDEKHTYPREYLLNNLVILFGGRVAEELVLNHMTTGAGNDIEKATDLARRMVCEWGMSEKLGPMTFGKKEEEIFLGRDFTQKVDYSESTAIEIDAEVRRIIQDSYHKAKDLLKSNLRLLHKVAETLLEKEVLDGSEIDAIVREFGGNGGAPLTPSAAAAVA